MRGFVVRILNERFHYKLSVCSANSLFLASPVNVCQKCLSVCFSLCFFEKKLNLSRVLFLGLQNASSQFVRIFCSVTVATLISGNLSVILFMPAAPNDRKRTLIIFLSAAYLLRLFIKTKFLGACSVAILNNSLTDNDYFSFTATVKRSRQSSQSVLSAVSAESRYAGNPTQPMHFLTSPLLHNLLILAAPCCSWRLS